MDVWRSQRTTVKAWLCFRAAGGRRGAQRRGAQISYAEVPIGQRQGRGIVTSVGVSTLDGGGNPYITLLYEALRAKGIAIEEADLHPWVVYRGRQRYDVLHIHWPEYIMVGPGKGLAHAARAVAAAYALRISVGLLKRRGVRIVWTAHNIRPHSPDAPRAQVHLYRWLAADADAILVHTRYAAELVRQRLGRTGPIYVARHGNYVGVYASATVEREALRARYGVGKGDQVLLAFGQVRAYKRLVELVGDFASSSAPVRLMIAGPPKDADVARTLRKMVDASDRVVFLDRYIPDSEVAELYSLADLAVINYSEIFSSGALMLALSLGRAVLAPSQGTANEIVARPALFAWDHSPMEVLDDAFAVAPEVREAAALAAANSHGWTGSADVHIEAYEGTSRGIT